MSTYPQLTLGWRLRMALEHAGVTVNEMMDILGVRSRDTMAAWLHDRRRPKAAYVRQWAIKTGVPYEWLSGRESGPDVGVSISARTGRTPRGTISPLLRRSA